MLPLLAVRSQFDDASMEVLERAEERLESWMFRAGVLKSSRADARCREGLNGDELDELDEAMAERRELCCLVSLPAAALAPPALHVAGAAAAP